MLQGYRDQIQRGDKMEEYVVALMRMQLEFYKKGFLLCIKETDAGKFRDRVTDRILNKGRELRERFGIIAGSPEDLLIDVDEVIPAFIVFMMPDDEGALARADNIEEKLRAAVSFIRESTVDDQICLCLLYRRLVGTGEPLRAIRRFSKGCNGSPSEVSGMLCDKAAIDAVVRSLT